MDEQIIPFEGMRMWAGDAPALFYAEIVFRSVFAYVYCFALVRMLSGRAVAQMSMTDFVLVIALGSAVGDMAFYADVPMLHALTAITAIILITKFLDRLAHDWAPLKAVFGNAPVTLVQEGIINKEGCSRRDMNQLEVMERLRMKGVRNLGEVEWAFMEADGELSVFRYEKPRPGLPIVPPHDLAPSPPALALPSGDSDKCCITCGTIVPHDTTSEACPNCHKQRWTVPVLA